MFEVFGPVFLSILLYQFIHQIVYVYLESHISIGLQFHGSSLNPGNGLLLD